MASLPASLLLPVQVFLILFSSSGTSIGLAHQLAQAPAPTLTPEWHTDLSVQIMYSVDCFGMDISTFPALSVESCYIECASVVDCSAFTFVKEMYGGHCYLKSVCNLQELEGTDQRGLVSGIFSDKRQDVGDSQDIDYLPSTNLTTLVTASCRNDSQKYLDNLLQMALSLRLHSPYLTDNVIFIFDGAIIDTQNIELLDPRCRKKCQNVDEYLDSVVTFQQQVKMYMPTAKVHVLKDRQCLTGSLKYGMEMATTNLLNIMQDDFIMSITKLLPVEMLARIILQDDSVDVIRYTHKSNSWEEEYTHHICSKRWDHSYIEDEQFERWNNKEEYDESHLLSWKTRKYAHGYITLSSSSQFSDMAHITTKDYYDKYIWPIMDNAIYKKGFMEHHAYCARTILPPTIWYYGSKFDGYFYENRNWDRSFMDK
jgi:hypothetical protein